MTSPTEAEMLNWVNTADVEELLSKQRFEPAGSPWFTNEKVAGAISTRLSALRERDVAAYAAASKSLGW